MHGYLDELRKKHRRLDRLIGTCQALGRQEELKPLKRLRLRLKDRVAALERRRLSST